MEFTFDQLREIIGQFQLWGDPLAVERYGSGHINDTFRVTLNLARRQVHYLLQRINHDIFKKPDLLMENIVRVTQHQQSKLEHTDTDASRKCLRVISTRDSQPCYHDHDGNWWCLYLFIENARTRDRIEIFRALLCGYLSEARFLNKAEIEELAFCGRVIAMTIGVRFLTDYLEGDQYFRTHRSGQNLDRCRVQFAMVRSMEVQEHAMRRVVRECVQALRKPPGC